VATEASTIVIEFPVNTNKRVRLEIPCSVEDGWWTRFLKIMGQLEVSLIDNTPPAEPSDSPEESSCEEVPSGERVGTRLAVGKFSDDVKCVVFDTLKRGLRPAQVYRQCIEQFPPEQQPALTTIVNWRANFVADGLIPEKQGQKWSIDPVVRYKAYCFYQAKVSVLDTFLALDSEFGEKAPLLPGTVYKWFSTWEKQGVVQNPSSPQESSSSTALTWDEMTTFVCDMLKKGLRPAQVYRLIRNERSNSRMALQTIMKYQAKLAVENLLPVSPVVGRWRLDPKVMAYAFLLYQQGLSIQDAFLALDEKFGWEAPLSPTSVSTWYKRWQSGQKVKNRVSLERMLSKTKKAPEVESLLIPPEVVRAPIAMEDKKAEPEEVLDQRKVTQLTSAEWDKVRWRSNELMRCKKRMDRIREILAEEFNVIAPVPATLYGWWRKAQEEEARAKQQAVSPKTSHNSPSKPQKKAESVQQITRVYPEPRLIRKPEVPLRHTLRDWSQIKKQIELFQNIPCDRNGLPVSNLHTCLSWQHTWRVEEPDGPAPHLQPCRLCPNWIKEIDELKKLIIKWGMTQAEPDPEEVS